MKRVKTKSSSGNKSTGTTPSAAAEAVNNKPLSPEGIDDEDLGFGGWLKSDDGLETMKLFALANSIVLLTTVAYPHLHTVWEIIYDIFYGPDSFF